MSWAVWAVTGVTRVVGQPVGDEVAAVDGAEEVGALLVVGALVAARRGTLADAGLRGVRAGPRQLAVGLAALVALAVAAAVVALGLG